MIVSNPLLLPITKVYQGLVRLRNHCYASGVLPVQRLQKPVISIGNLTFGGTGKTPTVIAIARLLQTLGVFVAVLSRGYKGRNRGGPLLVSDGKTIVSDSRMAGDEALVVAKNVPGAVVAVGADRANVGAWVESRFPIDVHLLDDGFQHLRLHRDLNLLLIDATDPFGNFPPAGRLREPLEGIKRSDAVLLTRVQDNEGCQELIDCIRDYKASIHCFLVRQRLVSATTFFKGVPFAPVDLQDVTALAFAGIGNPEQFFDRLAAHGVHVLGKMRFPDHHRYRSRDVERIKKECRELEIDTVITTEKDAENLDFSELHPLKVVIVKVAFEFDDLEKLIGLVREKIRVVPTSRNDECEGRCT